MKNVFDINWKKDTFDGEMFCTKRVSADLENQMDDVSEKFNVAGEKAQLSLPMIIIEIICLALFAVMFRAILKMGLKSAFSNAPFLLWGAVIAMSVFVAIGFYREKKKKQADEYVKDNNIIEDWDELSAKGAVELGIPSDSIKVDILSEKYMIKKGIKEVLNRPVKYNVVMYMYFKDGCLCFSDTTQEFGIPLNDIIQIRRVVERVNIAEWNKEEEPKGLKYEKYKLGHNNYGLFAPAFYLIHIQNDWGAFEIQMPDYEEEAVRMIAYRTGRSIQE